MSGRAAVACLCIALCCGACAPHPRAASVPDTRASERAMVDGEAAAIVTRVPVLRRVDSGSWSGSGTLVFHAYFDSTGPRLIVGQDLASGLHDRDSMFFAQRKLFLRVMDQEVRTRGGGTPLRHFVHRLYADHAGRPFDLVLTVDGERAVLDSARIRMLSSASASTAEAALMAVLQSDATPRPVTPPRRR